MDERSRHLEYIRTYLPKYLSPKQQDNLFRVLKENFPHSTNPNKVYLRLADTSVFYQGDVIIDVPFSVWNSTNASFDTKYYTAAILSNTCDINPQNLRPQDGVLCPTPRKGKASIADRHLPIAYFPQSGQFLFDILM